MNKDFTPAAQTETQSVNWQQIKQIFLDALEIKEGDRANYLDKACANNKNLRAEVEQMLAAHFESESFIENPAVKITSFFNQQEEQINADFGNYRIVREIGFGGMGAVFLVERIDGEFRQQAALKIVRQNFANRELVNRFKRERQILASLNHPYIARLLDGGVSREKVPFLVMEYVDGLPVTDYAAERDLSIDERLKLFVKICSAVAEAHRNLIIHRDLKPSNIFVTRDGTPKLLDFGLAKLIDDNLNDDQTQTQTAFRAMTPAYASPEQLRGESVTTSSDIYSLGVVLYELLTSHRPFHFKNQNLNEMINIVCQSEPARPSEAITERNNLLKTGENFPQTKNESLSNERKIFSPTLLKGDLDNIILTAMMKEPARRYPTVEKFAEDIERHLQGLPVRARPNTFFYRAEKFAGRNKAVIFAAVFVFLAIVSALGVSLWQTRNASRQRDVANMEKAKAERINKFLQQMLSFSNQSVVSVSPVAQSKNVTVNQMLDEIAPAIETEFADAPEIRAQILRTVGSSYASQGLYEKAEKYLRAAMQAQSASETDAESAATMLEFGVLLYRRDKIDEANEILEKTVAFYRKQQQAPASGFNPANLAVALDHLAIVKFYQGDAPAAVAMLKEAFQIVLSPDFPDDQHFTRAFIKVEYGTLISRTSDAAGGEKLLREAIAEFREDTGKPRWEFGNTLTLLGGILNAQNKSEEASSLLAEGEAILRETLGEKNFYVAGNLNQEAIALYNRGEYRKAEEKARQSLEMFEEIFPDKGKLYKLGTARGQTTLGNILNSENRPQEGEQYFRQSVAYYESQPKKDFTAIVQNKIALSRSLLAQNRAAEAERVASDAHADAVQNLGEENFLTRTAIDNLNKIYKKKN